MTGARVLAAPGPGAAGPVLSVRELTVELALPGGPARVVEGVSFEVRPGEVFGIVGESGCGKSVTMLAVMGLLPAGRMRVAAGEIRLRGRDLLALTEHKMRAERGRRMAMIFQDPMTSLNPVLRVGSQIAEAIRLHQPQFSRGAVRGRVAELLALVGVPDPERRSLQYPHEFSGGMRQRVMIAMAMANDPDLLIADEPTTALDVTIQAQVMEVLARVRGRTGAAMILVSHDLGLVAETVDRVAVMYGGRIVEMGGVEEVFDRPCHPYTAGLMASLPRLDAAHESLYSIPGQPPRPGERAPGCVFHPRCGLHRGRAPCVERVPPFAAAAPTHRAACHFWDEVPAWATAEP